MVYYVTVSGYIQEVRFDTDSTLHQLLRKAGKLYRSEEEAKRYLDKDYKDLIIQEEELGVKFMNGKLDSFILGILFTVSLQLYMRNKSYFNLIICILLILYAIRQIIF